MSNRKQKTAIYIRVSTDIQAEEGYSIDVQKEQLSAYCVSKGYKNYEYFVDGGWTGSNIERPQMQRLIDDVKNGMVERVIVYKLDRLSRSQKDTLYLIEDLFLPYGVDFVSLTESLDTSTPMGRAMIGILAAFAQLERENIRMRTRMGMLERVKEGYWMGGGRIPFGYDYDSKQGILIPNEDAVKVRQIFDLYLKGYSRQKIADMLGLKYERLVTQILRRKSNLGIIEFRGQEYKGKHQPIIDEETYYRAMQLMDTNSNKNIRVCETTNLLTGLVYCGKCGAKMAYKKWSKNGKKFMCYSQQISKKYLVKDENCTQERIWCAEVEDAVINDLFRFAINFNMWEQERSIPTVIETIEQEIGTVTKKIKNLLNLYAKEEDDVLLEVIGENKAKLEKLKVQLKAEQNNGAIEKVQNSIKDTLNNISSIWEYMTFKERQTFIRQVVNKITVTDNNIHIDYKL